MKKTLLLTMTLAMMCTLNSSAQNKVKYLSTNGHHLDITQIENTDQTVRLSRYLFAGYNTICLPMSVSADQLAQAVPGAKVERLAGIGQEGSTIPSGVLKRET